MGKAYTPGLIVSSHIEIEKIRRLSIKGEVLVTKGQYVHPLEVVARAHLPGLLQTIKLNEKLGLDPEDLQQFIIPPLESWINKGDLVAESKGLFGWFKNSVYSNYSGTFESFSDVTGHMFIREVPTPIEVKAYINGTVKEVLDAEGVIIRSSGAMIQGIFGVGGERYGELRVAVADPSEVLEANHIKDDDSGKILIGGSRITGQALERAAEIGVIGLVAGSIHDEELTNYVGYEIGVAITGQENIPMTLIITEGFGDLAMANRTFTLFQTLSGHMASMNGTTQIRAGVVRPEVIVTTKNEPGYQEQEHAIQELKIGSTIRMIREPYFGKIGHVVGLPSELMILDSEVTVRVLEARLDHNQIVVVPRANIEILEE